MPTVAMALLGLVRIGMGELMVIDNVAVPVPVAFVAERDTFEVPATVGVPVIAPVVVLTDNPAGRTDALNVVGELLAVIW